MDEELKKLLQENINLSKKNHEVMTKVLRYQKWAFAWGVIKWTVIIGSTVGAFYLLRPMFDSLIKTYAELLGSSSGTTSIQSLLGQ